MIRNCKMCQSAMTLALAVCGFVFLHLPGTFGARVPAELLLLNSRAPLQLGKYGKIQPTLSGYININESLGSALFYAYYEALKPATAVENVPILLWLQGGPGCASTFGGFYGVGPFLVTDDTEYTKAEGSWNKHYGLLLIDQPIGSGYSPAGNDTIPPDQPTMAEHLYTGIQGFFREHKEMQKRPFFITGESYAGKYVPAIATRIIQASQPEQTAHASNSNPASKLQPGAPLFRLVGVAIGNGLTDPRSQTLTMAGTTYAMGLISSNGRDKIEAEQDKVVALIDVGDWPAASSARAALLELIQNVSGTATLLDVRRDEGYDGHKHVEKFLDLPQVKEAMGALQGITYQSCSKVVDKAMGDDVMKSVKELVPGVLEAFHVLLYQGAYDAQDGPASNDAWLSTLDWPGAGEFSKVEATLWHSEGRVAGWYRAYGNLLQVVLRNSGHMCPHDDPLATQLAIEAFVCSSLAKDGWQYANSTCCLKAMHYWRGSRDESRGLTEGAEEPAGLGSEL